MENIWVLLGLVVFSIVLGMIWYGPLFGKKFSWANDWQPFDTLSKEEQEKAKRESMPYYWMQALMTLIQMMVLAWFVSTIGKAFALETALWLWIGFIVPIMASNAIWSMKSFGKRFTLFWIGSGYQLVLMGVAGYVLGM